MNAANPTCTDDTIVAEVFIAAPQSLVWAALTDGELLATWWGSEDTYRATGWTLDVRVGGKWISHGISKDGRPFSVGGEFVNVEPISRLVMTWKPDWDPTPPTTIDYTLAPDAGGTRLRLTHSGFTGYGTSRDSHAMGWTRVLGWLGEFVEKQAAQSRP